MRCPNDQDLWHALRCAWLAAATERPVDPRLAEDPVPVPNPAPRREAGWLH